jgi:hypothetical protein
MTEAHADQHLLDEFAALERHEQMILALLAITGEPVGKHAVYDTAAGNVVEPDGTPQPADGDAHAAAPDAAGTGVGDRRARLCLRGEAALACHARRHRALVFRDLCQRSN